jgi:hypothetical protein
MSLGLIVSFFRRLSSFAIYTEDLADGFEGAAAALLALTKCNSDGEWIKSLFELPEPGKGIRPGDEEIAKLVLASGKGERGWVKYAARVDRNKLKGVAGFSWLVGDIDQDQPWCVGPPLGYVLSVAGRD